MGGGPSWGRTIFRTAGEQRPAARAPQRLLATLLNVVVRLVHSGVLLTETFRRDGDADADWKTPFGARDQLARIGGHRVPHLFARMIARSLHRVQSLGPEPRQRYARAMCGRARLSSDVSEIKPRRPRGGVRLVGARWLRAGGNRAGTVTIFTRERDRNARRW